MSKVAIIEVEGVWKDSFDCHKDIETQLDQMVENSVLKRYLGMSQYVKYGFIAAHKALKDHSIMDGNQWGVYCGTAFGGQTSIFQEQCHAYISKGLSWMLPSMVMNKGAKSLADIIAIENSISGDSLTVLADRCSSGIALLHAFDKIKYGVLDFGIVIGAEHIDCYLRKIYSKLEKRVDVLNDGSCALIICREDKVPSKGVKGYMLSCESISAGSGFQLHRGDKFEFEYVLKKIIQQTLIKASVKLQDIDYVVYAKAFNKNLDDRFVIAIDSLFKCGKEFLLCASDIYGDLLGATPLFLLLTAFSSKCNKISYNKNLSRILSICYAMNGQIWACVIEKEVNGVV